MFDLGGVVTRTGTAAPPAAQLARRWLVLALLATAQLMLVLDVTVVNVALPDIGSALHLDRTSLPWVLTTYTLVYGGLMLLGGRISDVFGARRVMLAGLALFTASSLVCGIADDSTFLLAGRGAQGVGAALLSPAALALVMAAFPGPDRTKALGVWSSLSGLGAALGVVLGGLLTSSVGWRWIFAINVPIGLVILAVLPALVPVQHAVTQDRRLDLPGAALVTAGTTAAIYGLVNVGAHGWTAVSTLVSFAASTVLWATFVLVEAATTSPLIAVHLFRRRAVTGGAFLMVVATGLLIGGFFLGSFDLQREHGYSAVHVGLVFLPVAVATVLGANSAGHLLARIDTRTVAAAGLAIAGTGYACAWYWSEPVALVIGLSVAALGVGATFVTAFTSSLADADGSEAGLRSAIVGTFHELGGAIGVAVLASAAGASLGAQRVAADGFTTAFGVGTVAALVAVPLAVLMVPAVTRPGTAGQGGH
jgi:EmrB/QacA subfamily drug resistance transporter